LRQDRFILWRRKDGSALRWSPHVSLRVPDPACHAAAAPGDTSPVRTLVGLLIGYERFCRPERGCPGGIAFSTANQYFRGSIDECVVLLAIGRGPIVRVDEHSDRPSLDVCQAGEAAAARAPEACRDEIRQLRKRRCALHSLHNRWVV